MAFYVICVCLQDLSLARCERSERNDNQLLRKLPRLRGTNLGMASFQFTIKSPLSRPYTFFTPLPFKTASSPSRVPFLTRTSTSPSNVGMRILPPKSATCTGIVETWYKLEPCRRKTLLGVTLTRTRRSPGVPGPESGMSPDVGNRIFMPSSIPAGISTSTVFRSLTRPTPSHSPHRELLGTVLPLPPHA